MNNQIEKTLIDKLYLLTQIIQDVCDIEDIKSVAPFLTRSQFQILKILSVTGTKTVSEIANIFNVSRPAISKTVDKLVKQMMVDRTEVEIDRRSILLSLTRQGENVVINYNSQRARRFEKISENFSEKEIQQFEKYIERYIDTCVDFEENLDLMCMQCNGEFSKECSFKEKSDHCYYRLKTKDRE